MSRPTSALLFAVIASAALVVSSLGCGGDATPSSPPCVPGRVLSCTCDSSAFGLQTCLPDGSGFEECRDCSFPPSSPRAGFVDVTSKGLEEEGGSCLALEDFDRDGNIDLLSSSRWAPSSVTIRAGKPGGAFALFPTVTLDAVVVAPKCVTGDFDNDGLTDIVMSRSGKGPEGSAVEFWRNVGGLEFQLQESALDHPYLPDQFIVGITAWDYDNDGWLDIVVGRLFQPSGAGAGTAGCAFVSESDFRCLMPMSDANPGPRIFRNVKGSFQSVEGVLQPPFPITTNAMAVVDLNRDGKTDLLMSNDFFNNHYHLSSPTGFVHGEDQLGITAYNHGMGITVGDFDGDSSLDIYGVDIGPNNLWLGSKTGAMQNRALELGLASATHFESTWAPIAEDFDNDGRTDLFVAAAAVVSSEPDLAKISGLGGSVSFIPQYDMMFWNEHGVGFSEMRLAHRGSGVPSVIHAVTAVADVDGDGDLDLAVGVGTPLVFRFLENQQPPGNWLVVDVEGTKSNRDGIGVEVQLVEGGVVTQLRTIGMQGSLGQSWRKAHFGLGARDFVDEVRVRWTTGEIQSVKSIPANQTILVVEE